MMAAFVRQRTHEIGVRMAIGASSGDVGWLVVRRGLTLALLGVAVGIALSLAGLRSLGGLLFEVRPYDGVTLAGAAAVILAVSLVACVAPARTATSVDPLVALRGGE